MLNRKRGGKYLFIICFLVLFSCIREGDNREYTIPREVSHEKIQVDKTEGQISIDGDQILYSALSQLLIDFKRQYPNIKTGIGYSNSVQAIQKIKANEIDIAMVSHSCKYLNDFNLKCVPIARDVLVFIVNFNNPFLQDIVQKGLSPEILSSIYAGKTLMWNKIFSSNKEQMPIVSYSLNSDNGTCKHLEQFFNLKSSQMKSVKLNSENDILQSVLNSDYAIGVCSHTLAYDLRTNYRRSDIYIVPIDNDNNRHLSDNEFIYDDLITLEKAHNSNKINNILVRELCLVYNPNSPNIKSIHIFLNFLKKNSVNFLKQKGFFPIEIKITK